MRAGRQVAVVGSGDQPLSDAHTVGWLLGERGVVLVTGGLGGVMAEASRGAAEAGGTVVGLLPGLDRAAANEWVGVAIPTGLGELRNGLVVRAADAVIAIGGGYGTLSEVALALKTGTRVVGLRFAYDVPGVEQADGPLDAVQRALS